MAVRWEDSGKSGVKSLSYEKSEVTHPDGQVLTGTTKTVHDGRYVWVEDRNKEGKLTRVWKFNRSEDEGKLITAECMGLKDLEDDLKEYDVKAVGEETIKGQKMYVLEGLWDQAKHHGWTSKDKFWIGENDLVVWRYACNSEDGKDKAVTTFEVFNVKVDEKIDPKLFEYVPPEGAVIEDRTK